MFQLMYKMVKIKKNIDSLPTHKFPHVNLPVPVNVSKLEDCLNLGETSWAAISVASYLDSAV